MKTNKSILVLAAGQGTRMRSTQPKVLTELSGVPLLFHLIDTIISLGGDTDLGLVLGYKKDEVLAAIQIRYPDLSFSVIHQKEQLGTGHAARVAMDSDWGKRQLETGAPVLVLPGDSPLMPARLFEEICAPLGEAFMRLLTAEMDDPARYGRIVRDSKGNVVRIVEAKDASPDVLKIREVALSTYLFDSSFMYKCLQNLSNQNAQGEYYLTDVLEMGLSEKKKLDVLVWNRPADVVGINNPWELAMASSELNNRILKTWAEKGVQFENPESVQIGPDVELAEGVVLGPGVILKGKTSIGKNSSVAAYSVLNNVKVGDGVEIKVGVVAEDSTIANEAKVGPYAHLRPESHVGKRAKIGNFVELKKSRIGEATSVAHLSYVGDAEIGARVNIGCGFITCNYDGRVIDGQRKHKTIIEDEVFVGSDCQAIAPITISKGSYIASGSTINKNVPEGALAIARGKQQNKEGYAKRFRPKGEKRK